MNCTGVLVKCRPLLFGARRNHWRRKRTRNCRMSRWSRSWKTGRLCPVNTSQRIQICKYVPCLLARVLLTNWWYSIVDRDVGIVTGVTWDVRGRGIMQEAAVAGSWRNGRRMSRSRVQLSRNTHGTKVNAVLVQLDIIWCSAILRHSCQELLLCRSEGNKVFIFTLTVLPHIPILNWSCSFQLFVWILILIMTISLVI